MKSNNKNSNTIPGIIKDDRPLPHDESAESAVIAAILTEPSTCMDRVMDLLGNAAHFYEQNKRGVKSVTTAVFYNPRNQLLYTLLCEMYEQGTAIDVISVSHHLNQKKLLEEIGGEEYLLNLMGMIASTANLETWCLLVRDAAILRTLIDTCASIQDKCYQLEQPVSSILDEVEQKILNASSLEERSQTLELKTLIDHKNQDGAFTYLLNLAQKKEDSVGISSGYPDLDNLITGFRPGEMFVLAARPSIGKTSFALNLVSNIGLNKNKSVGFFSLEMTAEQLAVRMLCTESGYSERDFRDGKVTDIAKVTQAAGRLCRAKIFIDPTPALRIRELRSKARKMASLHNIEIIVIDYLQLMKAEIRSDNRQEEVSAISSGIKALAKELKIPIIVLAQLNREVEKTQGTPKLSHLRESGAIEQDADIVAFLHRDRETQKDSSFEAQTKGLDSQLIIEKNRNGSTGLIPLLFFPHLMLFTSKSRYSDEDLPPPA
jgi:replicative DNA helicase